MPSPVRQASRITVIRPRESYFSNSPILFFGSSLAYRPALLLITLPLHSLINMDTLNLTKHFALATQMLIVPCGNRDPGGWDKALSLTMNE